MTRSVNPPPPSGRTWSMTTTTGAVVTGHLPAWARADPSRTGVPLERLRVELSDIVHEAVFGGAFLRVCPEAEDPGGDSEVFVAYLQCSPHAEHDPRARTPAVNVRLYEDLWLMNLEPPDIAAVAAAFRAFASLLTGEVAPALDAARTDWAAHHPAAPAPAPRPDPHG